MPRSIPSSLPVDDADAAASLNPLRRDYDAEFQLTPEYHASLPDLMCQADAVLHHAPAALQQVGISGFRLPLRFLSAQSPEDHRGSNGRKSRAPAAEKTVTLDARVSGTIALPAHLRAINMSRIIRTFYEFQDEPFTLDTLPKILARFREKIGGTGARLRLDFAYPMLQPSLRSGLAGYQYYDAAFEAELSGAERHPESGDRAGSADDRLRRWLRFDFVYSSACPCSAELAEHARDTRGVYAIPHSQRSRARLWVEVSPGAKLALEDLQAICKNALVTETQVMVRRGDEQAFAELNGANVKFVEDAARLLHRELVADARIHDFQVACAHLESLHSHDAVAVICKGVAGGYRGDFTDFGALAG
ncbi:MAG: GTP cyclohydrolase I FolE2 [Verrucomicrobia bacterium]|nr:GTP cyclohydrolase I FolE2 [Verrucomicrobiota bacterium]